VSPSRATGAAWSIYRKKNSRGGEKTFWLGRGRLFRRAPDGARRTNAHQTRMTSFDQLRLTATGGTFDDWEKLIGTCPDDATLVVLKASFAISE